MIRDQIHAVLLALHGDSLLLPNVAVAEVLSRDALQPSGNGPPWLLGHCMWNARSVPVVRFETLNCPGDEPDPRRERIVVLHSVGAHLPSGHLALVIQGYPHLVTLNRSALRPAALDPVDRDELILARVQIASQMTAIPDLETIEAEIARAQMAR